jgi:hypothetical protein
MYEFYLLRLIVLAIIPFWKQKNYRSFVITQLTSTQCVSALQFASTLSHCFISDLNTKLQHLYMERATRLQVGGPRNLGLIFGKCKICLVTPERSDLLWVSLFLLQNAYRGLFSCGYSGKGVKLTSYLYLVPRPGMRKLNRHSPPYVLKIWCLTAYLTTGTDLHLHLKWRVLLKHTAI